MSVARQWKSGVCWSDAIDVNSILNVIRQENTRKVHNCLALPIRTQSIEGRANQGLYQEGKTRQLVLSGALVHTIQEVAVCTRNKKRR
jgi:hypothetical protein